MMHYSSLRKVVIGGGLLLVCLWAQLWPGVLATVGVAAQPGRPTIPPTAVLLATATPQPKPARRSATATPLPAGRITGTVIDRTTGAPASGIAVRIGEETVLTDANGNYARSGLAAGTYRVALVLAASQGIAEQEALSVMVADGATVVQHLFFHSPASVAAPPSAERPSSLPRTGGAGQSAWGWGLFGFGFLMLGSWLSTRSRKHARPY